MQHSYETFTATDWVSDDNFLKHHLSPSSESNQFWQQWLGEHPQCLVEWTLAGRIVDAVLAGLRTYSATYLSEQAEEELMTRIQATNRPAKMPARVRTFWQSKVAYWAAAACFFVALGAGYWFFESRSALGSLYNRQIANLSVAVQESVNETQQPKNVKLPDGSLVTLAPHSRLSYAANYGHTNRTVYLLGEARFNVTKNPQKPFFVYANEVVTKVLGTRFVVRSIDHDSKVTVTVEQGHVSVYRGRLAVADKKLDGVLLLPNQQVVFSRATETFAKGLVPTPRRVDVGEVTPVSFKFEETPITEVFNRLEKAYGVTIVYNADLLRECQFTSALNDESLYLMLDIVTQSIGATYETVDAKIVINSDGCQSN